MAPYVLAEYIWIDGDGGYRCKTKVIHGKEEITSVEELPVWNYDGSSTGQAPGDDSEVLIRPQAIFKDPFRGGNNILVITDTVTPHGVPIPTNTRAPANEIFEQIPDEEIWFGVEQEYTLFKEGIPLGWPKSSARSFSALAQVGFPAAQGPYYCSVGADVSFGREICDAHLIKCLEAGVKVSGTNGEVMPGQWEYQVGPCTGIESGDHMTASRWILHRVCEDFGVVASLDPKPIPGDWNGAGCHTNFSTKNMREKADGYKNYIIPAIEKLGAKHDEHIACYGVGNEKRLTGAHETQSIDTFSWGVADRGASIRVPNTTAADGYGYCEDRRPASNMDPYVVTSKIAHTVLL